MFPTFNIERLIDRFEQPFLNGPNFRAIQKSVGPVVRREQNQLKEFPYNTEGHRESHLSRSMRRLSWEILVSEPTFHWIRPSHLNSLRGLIV